MGVPVKQGVGLHPPRIGDYILRASRSQGQQEKEAGMVEIIIELRLIFPWPTAAAEPSRG